MSELNKRDLDNFITGHQGEDSVGPDQLMRDEDWVDLQKARNESLADAPLGAVMKAIEALPEYVAWQLAEDRETYGDEPAAVGSCPDARPGAKSGP